MGLIAGLIAKALMPGRDPGGAIITTLLGIVGAVIGGFIGQAFGYGRTVDSVGQLLRDNFGMKQEPRPNSHSEVESAIQDFIQRAKEKGYDLTYEEARKFIEPRMASNMTH